MQLTEASGDMGLDPYAEMRKVRNLSQTEQASKAACQFEGIFVRQILTESLKPMIKGCFGENTPGKDIYQSMMVDSMAQGIENGGGMGLSNTIQLQLQQGGAANRIVENADDNA